MRKLTVILYSILVLSLFQLCTDEKLEKEKNLFYSTGSNEVSELVSDFELGIKFNPPKDWLKRSAETTRKVERRGVFEGFSGEFIYDPGYVFFDDSTLSVLSLGHIIPPDSLKGKENLLNLYAQALSDQKSPDKRYDVEQFEKDQIRFTLFTIERANIISKRLIFQNKFNDLIQFEYTSRSDRYKGEEEKILQSIGSIKLL